jgi:membrane-bound lytic murein transglycosylase D
MNFCVRISFLYLSLVLFSCQPDKKQVVVVQEKSIPYTPMHFHLPKLPEQMTLFGEKVDLKDLDIRERLDKELHTIVYRHSHIFLYFKRANRYFPFIEKELNKSGVSGDFKYLAVVESGLEQGTSSVGAQGFWQFMPRTAKEYGLRMTNEIDERRHVSKSTIAACKYLKSAKDTLGSWMAAAAAYNRGVGGVRSDMKKQKVQHFFDTFMNSETSRYVIRIMAMKLLFENPNDYGFDVNAMEVYSEIKVKEKKVFEIKDLSEWALQNGSNLKIVKLLNPWILGNKLSKNKVGYQIVLPLNDEQLKSHN